MRSDVTLRALRDASPRSRSGFEDSIARYDALRLQIAATPVPTQGPPPHLASRRRVIGFSAAAAAALSLAAVIVGLTVSATSPASAYAAARKALATTAAARSGTMTITATGKGSTIWTLNTTRWNGDDIAMSSGPRHLLGLNRQLLLIGGGADLQTMDGQWLHYPSETDVAPTLTSAVQLARDNVAGNTAEQILGLATGLRKTLQPGGTILYTGTIPNNTTDDPHIEAGDDSIMRMIDSLRVGNQPGDPGGYHNGLQLEMTVASSGLVRKISVSFQQHGTSSAATAGTTTWSVTYSRLGNTPPITAPADSTSGAPR